MQFVSLSTEDRDLGIVEKSEAKASAQRFADKEGETVTMRDPTSDKVLGKVKPTTKGKAAKTTKAAAKPTRKAKGAVKAAKGTKAAETAKPTNAFRRAQAAARHGGRNPQARPPHQGCEPDRAERADQVEGRTLEVAVQQPEEERLCRPVRVQVLDHRRRRKRSRGALPRRAQVTCATTTTSRKARQARRAFFYS
jgi:hypothetical protein